MTSAVSFVRGQMVGITTETTMRVGQVESVTPSGQVVLRDGTRFSKDGQRMNGTPEQRRERIERLTDELIARYEAIDPGFAASRRRERQDRLLAKIEWARVPVGAVNRIWMSCAPRGSSRPTRPAAARGSSLSATTRCWMPCALSRAPSSPIARTWPICSRRLPPAARRSCRRSGMPAGQLPMGRSHVLATTRRRWCILSIVCSA